MGRVGQESPASSAPALMIRASQGGGGTARGWAGQGGSRGPEQRGQDSGRGWGRGRQEVAGVPAASPAASVRKSSADALPVIR